MFETAKIWLKNKRESLTFKYMPKIANAQIWASTLEARQKLKGKECQSVLIDSPIRSHAITHESAWVDTGTKKWGGVHPINTGYVARIPVHSVENETPDYEDICYLGALIGLVKYGHLKFFTSSELIAEQERQPASRFRTTGYSDYSILDMVPIESIDGEIYDYVLTSRLLGNSDPDLAQLQRDRIHGRQDELHQSILRILGSDKHSQDAWHLRTAQNHNCQYFLTMDRSLCRMYKQHQTRLTEIGVDVIVLTPTELGKALKLRKVPPYLFSYNDASFPVRSDLHLPNQKRFPSSGRGTIKGS